MPDPVPGADGAGPLEFLRQAAAALTQALRSAAEPVVSDLARGTLWPQAAALAAALLLGLALRHLLLARTRRGAPGDPLRGCIVRFSSCVVPVTAAFAAILSTALARRGLLPGLSSDAAPAVLSAAVPLLLLWAFFAFLMPMLRLLAGRRRFGPGLRRAAAGLFWTLVILQAAGLLRPAVRALQSTPLPLGSGEVSLWTALLALFAVLLLVGAADVAAERLTRALSRTQFDPSFQAALSRILRLALTGAAVLLGLSIAGVSLSVLSAVGAVLGAGLGLGMKSVAASCASGFLLLFERSVRIGDLVEVEGFRGTVTQIRARCTVLRRPNGEEFVVPNETLIGSPLKNYSRSEGLCPVIVDFGVAYECDLQLAMRLLAESAACQPRAVPENAPSVWIENLGDSAVVLGVVFWIRDPEQGTEALMGAVRREMMRRCREAGVEIPVDKADMRLAGSLRLKAPA